MPDLLSRTLAIVFFASHVGFAQSNPLSLQSIQPGSVFAGSGATTVTLKGTGFTNSMLVNLSNHLTPSTSLTPVFIDETTLQVTLPGNQLATSGTIDVSVVIPGTAAASNHLLFYVYSPSPPVVASMSPAGGLPGTTASIALTGTNLVGTTITFSGSGVTAVPDASNYVGGSTGFHLMVTVAENARLGTRNVAITTPGGSTTTCGSGPCTFSVVESGSWSHGPEVRSSPAVGRLLDGRILLAGGYTSQLGALSSAQIFDPSTNELTDIAPMNTPRVFGQAILLPDARVLLTGGYTYNTYGAQVSVSAVEIYDPARDTWSTIASRFLTGVLLLPNGKVLMFKSGLDPYPTLYNASLFDPVSGRFEELDVPVGVASLLSDGRVFLTNGGSANQGSSKIYDPANGKVSDAPPLNILLARSVRLLPDGRVLARGHWPYRMKGPIVWDPYQVVYDPKRNTVISPSLYVDGADVLLASEQVLIAGTIPVDNGGPFPRAAGRTVLYNPAVDQWLPQAIDESPVPPNDPFLASSYLLLDDGRAFGIAGSVIQMYTPPRYIAPAPVIGSVISSKPASDAAPTILDIRGKSFLPNSYVQLGGSRLVTLYLGAEHLVAFVLPALGSPVSLGVSVTNPGSGETDAVPIGFLRPLPIAEVETGAIRSGYVIITPDSGTAAPVATLTYGIVRDGTVQSQAAILPTPLTTGTSLLVDVIPAIGRNVGLAIANASASSALITLTLRKEDGGVSSAVSFSIPPRGQVARFISGFFSPNDIGSAFRGNITILSSIPVSIIGLRFSGQEFTTMPFPVTSPASPPQQASIGGANAVMFPQFAISGGWATTIGLVNTTTATISGRIDIFDTNGNPMAVTLNDDRKSTFTYSIPSRGSTLFAPRDTSGLSPF